MNRFAGVHWGEGLFLQPQHFQLWQGHIDAKIQRSVNRVQPYAWGVRELEIDASALENFMVSIPRCEVVLPDGTEVSVPGNADLPDLEIREALNEQPETPLEIRLGVPLPREGAANLESESQTGDGRPRRYRLETLEVSDENTGDNSRSLEVRRLNARLYLPGDEAIESSATIPIVRIVRSGEEEEALPVLDGKFTPPTLEIASSDSLHRYAREVLNRATARASALADVIESQNIDFAVEAGGSPEMMLKLHVLNAFVAYYQQFLRVPRLHPLSVYCELCRFAGELAIFARDRRTPSLPSYDHGGLGECFSELFAIVDDLLGQMYIARVPPTHFKPWGRFLVAPLKPEWFDARNRFYISVDSTLSREEVIHAMGRQVSIGSKRTIEELARLVLPGVSRHGRDRTPKALPERPQRVYFELDRRGGDEDLTVGTEELAVFNGSGKELDFSLYVVTGEDQSQFEI